MVAQSAPVIVIGMHRSGTSMITDVLESLGLFMGRDKNAMQEARFFLEINRWMLRESGGSWMNPEPVDSLLNNPEARDHVTAYLRFLMASPRVIRYLGWRQFLQARTPARLNKAWGWKDPQNTYTLPLWLDIFPDAKIIHIYRNGVDVASSLWVRSQKNIHKLAAWRTAQWRYGIRTRNYPHSESGYLTLQAGFDLWERYTQVADRRIDRLPTSRTRSICYEQFLEEPVPILQDLCEFAGLPVDQSQIANASEKIDPSRGNAYMHDPDLMQFYEQVKHSNQMLKYGYSFQPT